jgi:hypothetical protein
MGKGRFGEEVRGAHTDACSKAEVHAPCLPGHPKKVSRKIATETTAFESVSLYPQEQLEHVLD